MRSAIRKGFVGAAFASVLAGCLQPAAEEPGTPELDFRDNELPTVDTRPWLQPVNKPPAAWQAKVAARKDVLRHRFVRFKPPSALPKPRSRFVVAPFADTLLVLRMRRSGPIEGVGYSWFGMFEDEPRGFGGIVFRPDGRVFADIQAPDGGRFQVTNVGKGAYAILELEAEKDFTCGVGEGAQK